MSDNDKGFTADELKEIEELGRDDASDSTAVATAGDAAAEQKRRAEAEAERQRRLGTVTPKADDEPAELVFTKRTTDKFIASFGLLLLRVVAGGIMAIHGYQKVTSITGTTGFFTSLGLPQPGVLAWATGIGELAIGVGLLFGFAVRIAGLAITGIAVGALVLVKWGAANPFQPNTSGFAGELELLLAAVGLLLVTTGGGGWGIDGGLRRSRQKSKAGL